MFPLDAMKESKRHPYIVAIEGIDGSGKETQTELLSHRLKEQGKKVVTKSYPQYESFAGKEIGMLLSGESAISADLLDWKSMSLWYALDRWKDFQGMEKNLASVDFLLLNRFTLSSVAYQGARAPDNGGIDEWIFHLEHSVFELPQPDLYIILDVEVRTASENVFKKQAREYISASTQDVYEKDADLQRRVREKYLSWSSRNPDRCRVIPCQSQNGEMRALQEIHSDVIAAIPGQ
ncbi:dTMP kinase [Paraburkholderia fungorum]|uniref:Thymidylate kinase n=1 Tax=Paraburkholderia fungorum TaxID=134537 RepID=A0AAP5UT23_9BURK|nr:dTMP kinase [Paraburkholderia fungorum]MDT8837795.1 dTMP kinase [Paraburkholderia fungorum]